MIKNVDEVYDNFLNIQTSYFDEIDFKQNRDIFFEYNPTPYSVLESIFTKYPFDANDHLVDFGCGKGRILIMSAYHSCKHVTGYELNSERYETLLNNIKDFNDKFHSDTTFSTFNMNVDKAIIDDTANKFFFYNPFHLKVYIKVLNAIQESLNRKKREIYIFLYRPFDSTTEYIDSIGGYKFESESIQEFHDALNTESDLRKEFVIYSNK